MGKAVKAIAGIALIAVAPYAAASIVGALSLQVSALGFYAIQGAVTLIGASLAGGAFEQNQPDFDAGGVDSYAGQKLQTKKDNTSSVSQIYGENRLGSNIIWQHANEAISGSPNKDYWAIHSLGAGEIESFLELYANEDAMNSLGSNKYETKYVHIKTYTTTGSSGIDIHDLEFVTNDTGSTQTGLQLGFTNATLPADIAIVTIHQVYNATDNAHTQLDGISYKVEGLKVKTIDDDSTISTGTAYSQNPAEHVLDKLLNKLAVTESQIDISSFFNAKTKCDDYGYTCNIVFNSQSNVTSNIQALLATFRGEIVYSQGKFKLKLDEKLQTDVKTLTEDDILNESLSISMKGFQEIGNKVILKYINPNDNWLSDKVEIEDTDLVNIDGQNIEKIVDIRGVTNATQANKLAEITLNTMRYTEDESLNRTKQTPLVINFATTPKNAELEIGDVFKLQHSLLDRDRRFKVLSNQTDQSGVIQFLAREYCETHFKNSSGNYII